MQSMNIPMNSVKWERTHAQWIHLSVAAPLIPGLGTAAGIILCLVLWLTKRNESHFIDDHGREAINFHISMLLYGLALVPLIFLFIGIPVAIGLGILAGVSAIRGALAAGRGETFRYPICLRFVK